ncbi:MAG: hypothetical protein P8010_22970 [Desulfosarcinaceae bacterium]|jgi:hypothetical protein
MESNAIGKNTRSFGLSLAITSVFSAILMIIKESSQAVMNFMKTVTFHHWVTHGLFVIVIFVVLGWAFSRTNSGQGPSMTAERLITVILGAVVVSGVLIAGFYLIGD